MARGRFSSSAYSDAGTGHEWYIDVIWASATETANNRSALSWSAYARSANADSGDTISVKDVYVTINGNISDVIGSSAESVTRDQQIGSGSLTVIGDNVLVSIEAIFNNENQINSMYEGTINPTGTVDSSPVITSISIVAADTMTKNLTGGTSTIIKYKSTADCRFGIETKNGASIAAATINGYEANISDGVISKSFTESAAPFFVVNILDSHGNQTVKTYSPDNFIVYTKLTCNPVITRPVPTGGELVMTVSGNVYSGSLGLCDNTLEMQYRYKTKDDATYGDWNTVSMNKILIDTTNNTYKSLSNISLGDSFDYTKEYSFQVRVVDGGTVNGTKYDLSVVTATASVAKGVPIFDWGENDFNINVQLLLNNVNILDIIYPVGTIYMGTTGSLPTVAANAGTWRATSIGISGVNAWERTS